jgi:hypothetical protein
VTVERARKLATELDARTHQELDDLRLGLPHDVLSEVRAYLLRRSEGLRTRNNPYQLLKLRQDNGFALIVLGPTIDKGPSPDHFHLDSGACLSFGLALRVVDGGSELISFRYHYVFPAERSPKYIRFDLNEAPHHDPLVEPRCHVHPGLDDVRIPFSLYHPIEILDRIFFVLERAV